MAGAVEIAQDLRLAYARLQAAYQQSLRYAQDLKGIHDRLQRAFLQSLLGLANALEAKDPYTHGHSERVARLAQQLGRRLGCSSDQRRLIAQAGLLHDLGKIGVPEGILRKPGPLTEKEWAAMRRHPLTGAQILAPLEFFANGALIVRHHHEREDGSGYPDGLAGERIPIGARIVAVADVYDALTSERPYRPALTHAVALERLATEAGRTLDARLTRLFTDMVAHASLDRTVRD